MAPESFTPSPPSSHIGARSSFLLIVLGVLFSPFAVAAPGNDPRFEAAAALSRDTGGTAVLVMLEGRIVFEEYANGGAVSRPMDLASGVKSFCGVLAICAAEDGLLTLDEKLAATFTEWREDPLRRAITVRDLLTLTSGIPGQRSPDTAAIIPSYAEVVSAPAVAPCGTQFSYGAQPFQLFGELLRRKLAPRGEPVSDYFQRRLFTPLGITPGPWNKDTDGNPHLPSGAAFTARDWAKFGEMIRLDGRGILPPGRLGACFQGTAVNPGYGLTWWLPGLGPIAGVVRGDPNITGLPKDAWLAAGSGGQRLLVVPSLQLVALRQAPIRRDHAFDDRAWFRAVTEPLMRRVAGQP